MMEKGLRAEKLVGIFFLGTLLISYPVMTVFNVEKMVFGIPLLYMYIFAVWLGLIFFVFSVIRTMEKGRKTIGGQDSQFSSNSEE